MDHRDIQALFRSQKLPSDEYFFIEIADQLAFALYGQNGGLETLRVAYLVKRGTGRPPAIFDGGELPRSGVQNLGNDWGLAVIEIPYSATSDLIRERIVTATLALAAITAKRTLFGLALDLDTFAPHDRITVSPEILKVIEEYGMAVRVISHG